MEKEPKKFSSSEPIKISDSDLEFGHEVGKVAGTDLNACLTCMSCSGGCPMYQYMDYGPHGIMRLVVLGLKDEALKSDTIWRCLGCHTCAAVCPMAINIAGVIDHLRHKCIADKKPIGDKLIYEFHRSMMGSARRWGRTHKLDLMIEYKLRTLGSGPKAWLQDVLLGNKMILKGKLHFFPSQIMSMGKKQVKKIIDGAWRHYK